MTIGGILLGICLTVIIVFSSVGLMAYLEFGKKGSVITGCIATTVVLITWMGLTWYYNNTASGARAIKTQESNFTKGLERTIEIYDIEGDLVNLTLL